MRGLGREEEDLEYTVSNLSIFLTGLDELYREQMEQLKHQIHRAEKATQELEEQRTRAARAKYSLAALQAQMQEYEARRGIGGWIEEKPEETHWDVGTQTEEEEPEETHWDLGTQTEEEELEETHWDKGTQTEDDMMDQCLLLKKRPIRIEEESP